MTRESKDQEILRERSLRPSELTDQILAIGARCSALPDIDARTADEILGYDQGGLTR